MGMKPLEGVQLVEFASLMSGPYAGLVLADLGADVVKVETPAGDQTRGLQPVRNGMSASFYALNRGKRSVVLDLRHPGGLDVALRLVASADVMVENWRPGVAERLGVAPADMRAANPQLVTVSVRGFADEGPYATDRVYDSIIQATSGMASTQGGEAGPQFVRTFVPDKLAATTVVQSVLGALLLRYRTGEGSHVDVSMLDAAIAFLWPDVLRGLTFAAAPATPASAGYAPRIGSLAQAADGRWLTVSAVSDPEWTALCRTIGRPDLVEAHPTMESRKQAGEVLADALHAHVSRHARQAVLDELRAAGVACAPINSPGELLTDPQVVVNGTITEADRPGLGTVREVRVAPPVGGDGHEPLGPAPRLGADTDQVLAELGLRPEEIGELRASGALGPEPVPLEAGRPYLPD